MNSVCKRAMRQVRDELSGIQEKIEALRADEQAAYDHLPETIQQKECGEALYSAIRDLECACESMEEAIGSLKEVKNSVPAAL